MKKRLSQIITVILCATVMFGQSGCADNNSDQTTEVVSQQDTSLYLDASASVEDRVASLLSQMTLEEKIGQMVQAEQANITPEEVTKYYVGSVLSGGGSAPSSGNFNSDWEARVNELKGAAKETRLGIPLIYGIDAVHGNNNVYGATVFPHNIGLGAANDPELMTEIGEIVAEEVRAIGVQWTFAPALGNPQDFSWGRSYECFSKETDDIVNLTGSYILGLQGDLNSNEYMDSTHIVACAKHFIGEGYTTDGINQGNVDMTQEEFDALLESGVLDPYSNAVNNGVLTVMASYNSVDGVKCHENKHLIQEVLKDELGFKGLVIGDYNAVQQLSGATYKDQIEQCINAGVDMLMEPQTWQDCINYILQLVNEDRITQERIDDAVSRILYVKFKAGLFEEEIGGETEQDCFDNFGSDEHRAIARKAVSESLVLLQNDPVGDLTALDALKNAKNITVAGQKAYDIGSQCGGWTITWQGLTGKITNGTTIIEGIAGAVDSDVKISHTVDGIVTEDTDAVIAVFGEVPYAETDGDRNDDMIQMSAKDISMLDELKNSIEALPEDTPVVAIIIAGRPIDYSVYADMFDSVIMAWLPGTEGSGVSDVLFGDTDFTGTLNFDWYDLYPYRYGLNKAGNTL